jgi:hypothetical protein
MVFEPLPDVAPLRNSRKTSREINDFVPACRFGGIRQDVPEFQQDGEFGQAAPTL